MPKTIGKIRNLLEFCRYEITKDMSSIKKNGTQINKATKVIAFYWSFYWFVIWLEILTIKNISQNKKWFPE